ncbi:hypothetical protein GCM10010216_35940 [Streptomyces flaveolus]|nr:hypothetical protein GCM10010216_35940 [Streptomyces flaveolus]
MPGSDAKPIPSSPPTGTPYVAAKTGRQGSGAGTTGAAISRSRIALWYAESSGSCSDCPTGATLCVRCFTPP